MPNWLVYLIGIGDGILVSLLVMTIIALCGIYPPFFAIIYFLIIAIFFSTIGISITKQIAKKNK